MGTAPGTPCCRQERKLCGQPRGSALEGWELVQGVEDRLKTPLCLKGVGPSPLSPKGDSCRDSQDTGASNQGITQQHKGWRKGQILALISATSLADLFCTVTE